MTRRGFVWVTAGLSAAFLARVVGQAVQKWAPVAFLPPFEDFQGSGLPYSALLSRRSPYSSCWSSWLCACTVARA